MVKFLDNMLASFRGQRKAPVTEATGVGGTPVYGGYVLTGERSSDLSGTQRYVTYNNIVRNCSIVAAAVRLFVNLVGKSSWRFEPPEDGGARGEEIAELVDKIIHDMTTPWHRVIRRAAMYRFHGFSVQEWTAKRRDDGVTGLLDIEARPQSTIEQWDLDVTGTVHGVVQVSPQDGRSIYLPRRRLVYLVDDAIEDSPEGLGLLRHTVEAERQLRRFEQLEGYGFETDLRGIPVGRVPGAWMRQQVAAGNLKAADAKAAEQTIRDFIQNHIRSPALGLVLESQTYATKDESQSPSDVPLFDMQLLQGQAGVSSQAEVDAAITRKHREIARVLGVEHLLLGEGAGSYALSQDKTDNFALIVASTLQDMAEVIRADIVRRLFELNGWDEELMPTVKTDALQSRDIEQVTAALRDMATAGAVLEPDDPAIGEVRDLLGLSRPSPESIEAAMMARNLGIEGQEAAIAADRSGRQDDAVPGDAGQDQPPPQDDEE